MEGLSPVIVVGVSDTKPRTVDSKRRSPIATKKGHLARVCRLSAIHKPPLRSSNGSKDIHLHKKDTNWVVSTDDYEHYPDNVILTMGTQKSKPITVHLEFNGQQVLMQVEAVTLMSVTTQQELFSKAQLEQSSVKLQTYTTESITVLGTMEVQVW